MDARRERIYEARRAGLVSRVANAVGEDRAEALLLAWEAEAEVRGLARDGVEFWLEVEPWMAAAVSRPARR